MSSLGLRSAFGLVVLALAATACATPVEEDSGDQADAISADQAAAEFSGAKRVWRGAAGAEASKVGVTGWSVFAVDQSDFRGTVLFGTDAGGDVRHAILVGQRASAKSGYSVALVNYDRAGKTGASADDARVLAALTRDVDAIKKDLEAQRDKAVKDCAKGVATVALGALALAGGFWLAGAGAAAAGVGWVSSVVHVTGLATTGVGVTVVIWEGLALGVTTALDRTKSCGALL